MSTPLIEELARRVSELEVQNRRLKQMGIAFVCVLAVAGVVGANAVRRLPQIEAERFVVRDAAGQTRASLSLQDGQPSLALFDARGREQAVLRSTPDRASSLEFFQNGRMRMMLESASTGATHLQMLDKQNRPVTGLYAWPEGKAGLAVNSGQGGARLSVDVDGTARLGFASPDGIDRGGWLLARDGQLEFNEPVASASARQPVGAPIPVRAASYRTSASDACDGQGPAASALRGNAAMAP